MRLRHCLQLFRSCPQSQKLRPRPRPRLECLEDRTLLSITWINRSTPTDTFTPTERAVVDQAIRFWDSLILDFDNDPTNAPNTVNVTITGGSTSGLDLGGNNYSASDRLTATATGLPSSGRIQIDADAGGDPGGWYIDPVPADNAEFVNLATRFAAGGGPAGQDLYSAVLHELAHVLGFGVEYTSFAKHLSADAAPATTRTYSGVNGLKATLVPTAQGNHLDATAHPSDLMNRSTPAGTRTLPSDLDVRLLADAFGYTVALPSSRQTFLANFNQTSGTLTVNGEPLAVDDTITIDRQGSNLRITVGNFAATFTPTSLRAINILSGAGNDTTQVENTLAVPVTISTGDGNDTVTLSPTATFLDNLRGNLTVNGDAGTDSLTINDQFDPFNDTYTISAQGLFRSFAGQISYNGVENVTFNAGAGNNLLSIQQIPAGTTLTVHAGAGNDTVQVSSSTNYLDNLRGPLLVSGDTGTDSLTLNDQANAFNDTYLITATTVSRPFAAPITFDTFDQVTLNSGVGNGTFTVQGTAAGTALTLNTGDGNDTVTLGGTGNNLDALLGPLTVNGSVGTDTLTVLDQGAAGGKSYVLTSTSLARSGAATIVLSSVESIALNSGNGDDSITMAGLTSGRTVALDGGGGSDTLGIDDGNTWNLTANNQGTVTNSSTFNSTVTFVAVENLIGGAGRDTFVFSNGRGVSGRVSGGDGIDTLNYAAYTTAIAVNLATGAATSLGGGVVGIENVTGGSANDTVRGDGADNVLVGNGGNDLLVGGAGNDSLDGGAGRDFLLGGLGVDHLEGGADDDILLDGSTTNEANDAALLAILADWTRSDLSYDQRVTNLRLALNPSTVVNDPTPDELFGGLGQDWFWASGLDRTDQGSGEAVN